MSKPLVDCESESCRIQVLGQMTTLLGWTPVYDKYGKSHGSDPNKTTTQYKCLTCNKEWTETR